MQGYNRKRASSKSLLPQQEGHPSYDSSLRQHNLSQKSLSKDHLPNLNLKSDSHHIEIIKECDSERHDQSLMSENKACYSNRSSEASHRSQGHKIVADDLWIKPEIPKLSYKLVKKKHEDNFVIDSR